MQMMPVEIPLSLILFDSFAFYVCYRTWLPKTLCIFTIYVSYLGFYFVWDAIINSQNLDKYHTTEFVRCCIYLTTYNWIKSFLKITIERRAIYGNLENKINMQGENSIHKNNDADGKLQKVSGRCLILSSDHYVFSLRTSMKVRQT